MRGRTLENPPHPNLLPLWGRREIHCMPARSALRITWALLGTFVIFLPVVSAQNGPVVATAQATQEMVQEAAAPVTSAASGNVSLDFKDADISNVLRILSLKSKVNIVAGPEVKGTVTIRLEDVPWDKALDVVLRTYGYVYEREGNIIRVTTKENLETEELVTETFILNYTTAEEAMAAIEDVLSERGRIKSVERTNMLVITDIPTNLYKIRVVIQKLDRSTPQAFIDSKIVRTTLQVGENLGILWGTDVTMDGAQRPITFPFVSHSNADDSDIFDRALNRFFPNVPTTLARNTLNTRGFPEPAAAVDESDGTNLFTFGRLDFTSMSAVLRFLRERSNTKIISNPRITVLNHQEAKINVGNEIPIPTLERNESSGALEITGFEYRETGVVLQVTPHINDGNEILLELHPEVSSSTTSQDFGNGDFTDIPIFDVRAAETQVLMRSGETIAIGGLMSDSEVVSQVKVPILGDVPLIGKLFRSKRQAQGATNQKEETIFFITVTVVDTEGQPVLIVQPVSTGASEPGVSVPVLTAAAPEVKTGAYAVSGN